MRARHDDHSNIWLCQLTGARRHHGTCCARYASEPCCDWVYGKYINLKTGKEVKPPKGAVAPGSVESAASAANRYCAKPAEATAPPECSFSSMKDCRASLKGKAGSCYKF